MKKRIVATVTSDVSEKTIVVTVTEDKTHPVYKKQYKSSRKFQVHDEKNEATKGDVVEIEETNPVSKKKTWVLKKVITKAQG